MPRNPLFESIFESNNYLPPPRHCPRTPKKRKIATFGVNYPLEFICLWGSDLGHVRRLRGSALEYGQFASEVPIFRDIYDPIFRV